MGTLILLHRAWEQHPIVAVAVRDEHPDRSSGHPQFLAPGVFAPLDLASGGTWFGVNDRGLLAAVLPESDGLTWRSGNVVAHLSLGQLVKECLGRPSLSAAASAVQSLKSSLYRSFFLVLADRQSLVVARSNSDGIKVERLNTCFNVFTEDGYGWYDSNRGSRLADLAAVARRPHRPTLRQLFAWPTIPASQEHDGKLSISACRHGLPSGIESTATSVACLDLTHGAWSFRHRNGRPCRTVQPVHRQSIALQPHK
jgi:hypothetical protein